MRIITIFAIFSLLTLPMGIDAGDESNRFFNGTLPNIGWAFAGASVVGVIALIGYFYCMMSERNLGEDTEDCLQTGVSMMLSAFCFSYLYGFAAAPLSKESAWLSGWMVFLLVGLVPIVLHFNELVGHIVNNIAQRRRLATAGEKKVQNIR